MERNSLNPSQRCIEVLKKLEDCRLKSYQDSGGKWTIGYGATGGLIGPKTVWTQAQCEQDLMNRLNNLSGIITYSVKVLLTQSQFDALVCFTYNVGIGAFRHSTMCALLNKRDYLGAADEFIKWDHDNGKFVPGLLNRRRAERELFLS